MRAVLLVVVLVTVAGCGCGKKPVNGGAIQPPTPTEEPIGPAPPVVPETPPNCAFVLDATKAGEWQIQCRGPGDKEGEGLTYTFKKKPGPGGAQQVVDPAYKWNVAVKQYGDTELVVVIDFDSLGGPVGMSITCAGAVIVRADLGGRAVTTPVRLKPGRHEVEVVARRQSSTTQKEK